MSVTRNSSDDVINLSEVFASLWAHKAFIALIMGLSIFLSGYYVMTSENKFTARAIFQIKNERASGLNLSSELGALASLAGLAGAETSGSASLLKRLSGREFILSVSSKISLIDDPHFNPSNLNTKAPNWTEKVKKIIGWEPTKAEHSAIIENNIVKNFRKSVRIEESEGGAISISVSHNNPEDASNYTNLFMDEIRNLVENDSKTAQQIRLSYLSETLADALQEMEIAQQQLKEYALKNSALAQENFISGSLKLDEIRMERKKVSEISNLLGILENLITSGNLDGSSYEALRSSQPLVDDVDFRRILGMSETISAWTWPNIETIEAVSATLRDRIRRLDVEINNIEENAKIYAVSAEELAKFTRDAKIAEATYRVLIEQVKSQALIAGFQPETFKVFEYATPPLGPSSPKRKLILAIGAVLGFFIGCIIALANSQRRDVYYTKAALLSDINAQVSLKAKSVRRISRKPIDKITSLIPQRRLLEIDEAEIKLASKKLIYVLNLGGRTTAAGMARILSAHSSNSGRKVVLCDGTNLSEREVAGNGVQHGSGFCLFNLNENMSLVKLGNEKNLFTSSNFKQKIKDLLPDFDQIYVCSNNHEAILGIMALKGCDPSLVLIAGLRKTRKLDIKKVKSNQPVDILFYD